MPTFDSHANLAFSLVATAPSPATSGTSLTVTAGDGALFPTAPFNALVWPASDVPTHANAEIVRVTAISTDTFTITRAQEDTTTAQSIDTTFAIAATATAKTFTDLETAVAAAMTNPMTTSGDIIYGGASGAPTRLAKGSDGQVLTLASGVPSWAAASGGSSTPNAGIHTMYESLSGFYQGQNATGSVTLVNNSVQEYVQLGTGTTSGSYQTLTRFYFSLFSTLPKPWYGSMMANVGATTGDGYAVLSFARASQFASAATTNHVSIYFDKVSGAVTISSSTADGTTQSKIALAGASGSTFSRYVCVYHTDNTVDFYVDGVLKNTHTTNTPTSGFGAFPLGAYIRNSTADNYLLNLGPASLVWPITG